jgi:hypothetical protein
MTRKTELTLEELRDAEKVPAHSGDGSYLVRLGENDYQSVPRTGFSTLALHDDDVLEAGGVTVGDIEVEVDFDNDEFLMHRDGDSLRVPDDVRESFLFATHDRDTARLNDLFEEHHIPTVRRGIVGQFMPRFRTDDEIRQTDEGWLLNDEVLLRWDGSNEVADPSLDTHVVRGGSTKQQDVGRTALDIDMASLPDGRPFEARTPAGRTYELDEVEARFLTTVGIALDRNPSMYTDDLQKSIERSHVDAFTDPKSGIHHGHSKQKHRLQDLGVSSQTIERLHYNEHDHAGVVELAYREQEFRNAPFEVFESVSNDDDAMWQKINKTKENAPVPQDVNESLEAMYGE